MTWNGSCGDIHKLYGKLTTRTSRETGLVLSGPSQIGAGVVLGSCGNVFVGLA